ncbi:MAG: hypothetical protein PHD01_12415 [Geobacteraceae bacterium]|nr:hypothetical protein [Geobacteraceae bacterium]
MRIFIGMNVASAAAMVTMITAMYFFPFAQKAAGEEFQLSLGYTGNAYQETTNSDIKPRSVS